MVTIIDKIRVKIATRMLPSNLQPDEFFAIVGVDINITKLTTELEQLNANYEKNVNKTAKKILSAGLIETLKGQDAAGIATAIVANSSLTDLQKSQICAILTGSPKQADYLR